MGHGRRVGRRSPWSAREHLQAPSGAARGAKGIDGAAIRAGAAPIENLGHRPGCSLASPIGPASPGRGDWGDGSLPDHRFEEAGEGGPRVDTAGPGPGDELGRVDAAVGRLAVVDPTLGPVEAVAQLPMDQAGHHPPDSGWSDWP
jgi:hypothetical protein